MDNRLIEVEGFSGFYEIPGYSRYAISRVGVVLKKDDGSIVKASRNPDGYFNQRIASDSGVRLTWGRHRLMSYVFKYPGEDYVDLVVNHKNGVKGDDWLDNLEWVTYQGNAEHAGSLGLTDKCLPIAVRDVDTGVVEKFPSIVECARAMGVSKDAINYRVKAGEYRIFPERKQYRVSHGDEPWYVSDNPEIELMQNGRARGVVVRYVKTGKILGFNRAIDLASHLSVSAASITKWINIPNQPVLPGFIQIKWDYDTTPWREVGDVILELEKFTGKKSVKVINDLTKTETIFTSGVECAAIMNLKPTALNYRLKSRGGQVFSDGYRYVYYSDSLESRIFNGLDS